MHFGCAGRHGMASIVRSTRTTSRSTAAFYTRTARPNATISSGIPRPNCPTVSTTWSWCASCRASSTWSYWSLGNPYIRRPLKNMEQQSHGSSPCKRPIRPHCIMAHCTPRPNCSTETSWSWCAICDVMELGRMGRRGIHTFVVRFGVPLRRKFYCSCVYLSGTSISAIFSYISWHDHTVALQDPSCSHRSPSGFVFLPKEKETPMDPLAPAAVICYFFFDPSSSAHTRFGGLLDFSQRGLSVASFKCDATGVFPPWSYWNHC